MKNIICKIFGHNFDVNGYNKELKCPELRCVRCGKERLGYEYYVPISKGYKYIPTIEKKIDINIRRNGNKSNYAVEWISLDGRYCRNLYQFRKDALSQSEHLTRLSRWNSGVMKIRSNKQ